MTGKLTRSSAVALALLGTLAGAAGAQTPLTLGPRAGVTISTGEFEDPSTDAQTGTLVGIQLGLAVSRDFGRVVSVEAGLQLSREGFQGNGAHTGDLRSDNLSLPLLVRLRNPTRFSFHVTAGAAGKLSVRCRQTGVVLVNDIACDDPLMGVGWRAFDVAGLAGAGFGVPWGERRVLADLLLSWGLRDVDGSGTIPGGARNVSVAFTVAVLYPWDRGGVS